MKQTAVEWLLEKLKSQGLLIGEINNLVAVRQAKEIEKEQLRGCWRRAQEEQRKEFSSSYVSIKFEKWYEQLKSE